MKICTAFFAQTRRLDMQPQRGAFVLMYILLCVALSCTIATDVQAQTTAPTATTSINQSIDPEKQRLVALRKQAAPLWGKKLWPEVEAIYGQIIASAAATERDFRSLAYVFEEQSKFASALAIRTTTILREPNTGAVQNGMCWHWLLQNQPLKAREYCQKAVDLDEKNYAALVNLGHTYLLLENPSVEIAESWYIKSLFNIDNVNDLKNGPIADFELFIKNGWQKALSQKYKDWFFGNGNLFIEGKKDIYLDKCDSGTLITVSRNRLLAIEFAKISLANCLKIHKYPSVHAIRAQTILGEYLSEYGQFEQAEKLLILSMEDAKKYFNDQSDIYYQTIYALSKYYSNRQLKEKSEKYKNIYTSLDELKKHKKITEKINKLNTLNKSSIEYHIEAQELVYIYRYINYDYASAIKVLEEFLKTRDKKWPTNDIYMKYSIMDTLDKQSSLSIPSDTSVYAELADLYLNINKFTDSYRTLKLALKDLKEVEIKNIFELKAKVLNNNIHLSSPSEGIVAEKIKLNLFRIGEVLHQKHNFPNEFKIDEVREIGKLKNLVDKNSLILIENNKINTKNATGLIAAYQATGEIEQAILLQDKMDLALERLYENYFQKLVTTTSSDLLSKFPKESIDIINEYADFIQKKNTKKAIEIRKELIKFYEINLYAHPFEAEKNADALKNIYKTALNYSEAIKMAEYAYDMRVRVYGANDRHTLSGLFFLTVYAYGLKSYEESTNYSDQLVVKCSSLQVDCIYASFIAAMSYSKLGNVDKSHLFAKKYQSKVEELRMQGGLPPEERQKSFASFADSFQQLSAMYVEQNMHAAAFDVGDLSKARSLTDSIKAQSALRSLPLEKQNGLTKIRSDIALQRGLIEKNQQDKNADPNQVAATYTALDALKEQLERFDSGLKSQFPKYAQLTDLPATSANLAPQLLGENEAFISYLVRKTGQAQAFVLTKTGKVQWVDLGEIPSIGSTVEASRELISPSRADSAQGQLVRLKVGGYTWLLPAQALPEGASVVASTVQSAKMLLQQYWHDKLIKPVLPLAGEHKRWIISPDKDLALLPFDTLPDAAPIAETGVAGGSTVQLVQSRNLTVVQSFSVYALLKAREAEYAKLKRPKSLFAMGNAVYSEGWAQSQGMTRGAGQVQAWRSTDPELLQSLRNSSRGSGKQDGKGDQVEPMKLAGEQTLLRKLVWQNLPGTGREVEAVSTVFAQNGTPADTMVGAQASEAQLLALNASGKLRDYRYLLFSAHGYLAQNPSLSSLVLSQVGNSAEHDGYITADKWPLYDVRSDLTVLSACDTGAGKTQAGEGVMGLPYALFVAGNKNTLLSLWPVDDDATAEFMRLFFEKLKQGLPQPQALAETKRAFMRSALWSDPRYWAAFVLYGV